MGEIPEWICHKRVRAARIEAVVGNKLVCQHQGTTLHIMVDDVYMAKHKPQAGGYYVRYEDGYQSWSPASTFEDGYTLA